MAGEIVRRERRWTSAAVIPDSLNWRNRRRIGSRNLKSISRFALTAATHL